jgi:NADH-quinone oxidoreductase subunit A
MLAQYLPILLFLMIGTGLGIALFVIGSIAGKRIPNRAKDSAYECGFAAFEDARLPFDIRFYLVAILFIIFDLETAFFFPWAVALRKIGLFGFISMMVFLGLLVVGFIYEWRKGALEWE